MDVLLPDKRRQIFLANTFAAVAKFSEKAIAPVLKSKSKTGAFYLNFSQPGATFTCPGCADERG